MKHLLISLVFAFTSLILVRFALTKMQDYSVISVDLWVPLSDFNTEKGSEHVRAAILAAGLYEKDARLKNFRLGLSIRARDLPSTPETWPLTTDKQQIEDVFTQHSENAIGALPRKLINLGVIGFHNTPSLKIGLDRLSVGRERDPTIFAIPSATINEVAIPVNLRQHYFVRYGPTNGAISAAMIEAMKNENVSGTPDAVYVDDDYGKDLCAHSSGSKSAISERDVASKPIAFLDTTYRDKKCRDLPAAVYFCGSYQYAEILLRRVERCLQGKPADFKFTLVGSDALCTKQFQRAFGRLDSKAKEKLQLRVVSLLPDDENAKRYVSSYRERFGVIPDGVGYGSYRAVRGMVDFFLDQRGELPASRDPSEIMSQYGLGFATAVCNWKPGAICEAFQSDQPLLMCPLRFADEP